MSMHKVVVAGFAVSWLALGAEVRTTQAAPPDADEPEVRQQVDSLQATVKELREQVEQANKLTESLQQQVADLRAESGQDWLTEERAEQVRTLVEDVLADADTRSSLMANGMTAGWDNGFFLASADGAYSLHFGGQVQFRYIANFRTGSMDDTVTGFQLRRAKLWLYGNVAGPDIGYRLQMAANRGSTALELEEGYVTWAATDDLKLKGGRYAGPLLRDQFTSNSRQLTVERSTVAYVFAGNDNYVDGVELDWNAGDAVLVRLGANDGIGSGNPGGASNDFMGDATDFAVMLRGDVKLAGAWGQMNDLNAWDGEETALFLGGAVHYELAESGDSQMMGTTPSTGPYDNFVMGTLDVLYKSHGFNALAEGVIQYIDATKSNIMPGNMTNYGVVVQTGYMVVPDTFEPYVRYEYINIDNGSPSLSLVTAGFNYFFHKNTTKFTVDVVWALDPITAANTLDNGLSGQGLQYDTPGQDNQVALRVQFQQLF